MLFALKKYIEKGEVWKSGEFPENDTFNNFDIRRVTDILTGKPTKLVELSTSRITMVSCNNHAIHALTGKTYNIL